MEPDDLAKYCPIEHLEFVDEDGNRSSLKPFQKEEITKARAENPTSMCVSWDDKGKCYWYKQSVARVAGVLSKIVVCRVVFALLGACRTCRCIPS